MLRLLPLLALAALAAPSTARACAMCGAGDATLTAVGVEQPFAGRFRLSLSLAHLSYVEGGAARRVEVLDQRATLGIAGWPTEWLTLSALLPLVWRDTRDATLAQHTTLGLGDPEVRARFVVFRDRSFSPEHLVSLQIGARLPSPTRIRDQSDALLPLDAQTGTGSFDPMAGIAWSWFGASELSMHSTAVLTVPTEGTGGWRNGPSVRLAWQGQWQPQREIAVALGLDARFDAEPALGGESEPGAGAVLFASPALLLAPASDWLLWAIARWPLVQSFSGGRSDGPIVELGVALDV